MLRRDLIKTIFASLAALLPGVPKPVSKSLPKPFGWVRELAKNKGCDYLFEDRRVYLRVDTYRVYRHENEKDTEYYHYPVGGYQEKTYCSKPSGAYGFVTWYSPGEPLEQHVSMDEYIEWLRTQHPEDKFYPIFSSPPSDIRQE
jgi:hypothetical protein